jgi:hypothetical protein
MTQVNGRRALRHEVVVEKPVMADFVIGVVGNILGHVTVEHLQCRYVVRSKAGLERQINQGTSALSDGSAKFRVLYPQVCLYLF